MDWGKMLVVEFAGLSVLVGTMLLVGKLAGAW